MDTSFLPFRLPSYEQLLVSYDPDRAALWYYLNPEPRACFTTKLLAELRDFQQRTADALTTGRLEDAVHYLVLASAQRGVFNYGGDVALFAEAIKDRNRDVLLAYGRTCVDAIYANATNLGVPSLTTFSLIQGSALGGGFEAALSSNVVVAEADVECGFPEIHFNLFPGMGAFSLLARRIDPIRAQRMLESGAQYTGRTLYEMGALDVLADAGGGVGAVNAAIDRYERARNGYQAIRRARERVWPLSYQELIDIVEIWVDAALRVNLRDTRVMGKIANAQQRVKPPVFEGLVPPSAVSVLHA